MNEQVERLKQKQKKQCNKCKHPRKDDVEYCFYECPWQQLTSLMLEEIGAY